MLSLRTPLHLLDATMFWSESGGGVRRYLREKQSWIVEHTAWRHTIVTPFIDAFSSVAVPSLPLPGSGGYRLPWRREAAARLMAEQMPDLIEADDPYRLAWAALDVGQRLGIPTVAYCHSNLEAMAARAAGRFAAQPARHVARRYAARLYRSFDRVYAPSRAMLGHLQEWGIERAVHQPLGVDTRVFHPRSADHHWRRRLGLPADARLLVYAGRFAPEKNLHVLVDAVARLGPRYWLAAAGSGPSVPQGERVIVVPHVATARDLARLLASADAFVHAGDQETFGLAALEALACGTPLVARASEGLAELADGSVGAAVASGRADAFAQAISAVCERPDAARREAARGRALPYDWGHVIPALCSSYSQLIGREPMARRPMQAAPLRHSTGGT